jgi:hypothetical protein
MSASAANTSMKNVVAKPGKYCCVEQILEDNLIREVRTLGEMSAAAAV